MSAHSHHSSSLNSSQPRVVVLALASDFGCQIQLSNFPHLLETLDTIDLQYWQLVMCGDLPRDFDIAIIEGAVTTDEHVELLQKLRRIAHSIITIGACAASGGIPALAADRLEEHAQSVYGDAADKLACGRRVPKPVSSVVEVDYTIHGCPIDPEEFSNILQAALLGVKERPRREPLCATCKIIENPCFYLRQAAETQAAKAEGKGSVAIPCLGLVTRTGCGAHCISRGRPCTGCRGIAEDANLESARNFVRKIGRSVEEFDNALRIYSAHALSEAASGAAAEKKTEEGA